MSNGTTYECIKELTIANEDGSFSTYVTHRDYDFEGIKHLKTNTIKEHFMSNKLTKAELEAIKAKKLEAIKNAKIIKK